MNEGVGVHSAALQQQPHSSITQPALLLWFLYVLSLSSLDTPASISTPNHPHVTVISLISCTHMQARTIIDQHLLDSGSILLQGLPISQPEACEVFVDGMGFTRQKYEPYGGTRQKVGRWEGGFARRRMLSDYLPSTRGHLRHTAWWCTKRLLCRQWWFWAPPSPSRQALSV